MKKFNLANHLLIATPRQEAGPFLHSVIYVCQHDQNGAMGIMLNQPLGQSKFKDILTHLKIDHPENTSQTPTVLAGGPVKADHGFVIHSPVGQWSSSMTVTPDIAVTTSRDILFALASGKKTPQKALLALGYAGWTSGQLEEELLDNDWLAIPASESLIFETEPAQLWKKAMSVSGVKNLATLAHFAGHA